MVTGAMHTIDGGFGSQVQLTEERSMKDAAVVAYCRNTWDPRSSSSADVLVGARSSVSARPAAWRRPLISSIPEPESTSHETHARCSAHAVGCGRLGDPRIDPVRSRSRPGLRRHDPSWIP
jgi:hypothetical protein